MAFNTLVNAGIRQVSFMEAYLGDHPEVRIDKPQMDAAIQHAERAGTRARILAIASMTFALLALFGVIAMGNIVFGALFAVALCGGIYCYLAREAARSLRERQMSWLTPKTNEPAAKTV